MPTILAPSLDNNLTPRGRAVETKSEATLKQWGDSYLGFTEGWLASLFGVFGWVLFFPHPPKKT